MGPITKSVGMNAARKSYPSDVSDEEWALVAPYLSLLPKEAGQRAHSLREVFNGLRYIVKSGAPSLDAARPATLGDRARERLSGLSSGMCEFISHVTGLRVQPYDELAGERGADQLLGFAGRAQLLMASLEVGIVFSHDFDDDEEDGAHALAATAHRSLSGLLAAVACDRREAGELGDSFVGEGADLGHLGHDSGDGAIGDAFDRAERPIEGDPDWICLDGCGDVGFEGTDLCGNGHQDGLERAEHVGFGDQAALVGLHDLQFCQLAQANDEGSETLLCRRRWRGWFDMLGFGVPSDHGAIDPVGLLERSHGFGEVTHGAGIDDGCRQPASPKLSKRLSLVSTGRLHHHHVDLVGPAEVSESLDAFGGIGELPPGTCAADAGIESFRADVHSTEDVCHGNLPCPCDGQSSDCPVVRDEAATGPRTRVRLWPEGGRAPVAARGGRGAPAPPRAARWPPDPARHDRC